MAVKKVRKYDSHKKKFKGGSTGGGMVCVTPGNVRFFKSAKEASTIMGLKIPDIYHEMGTKGKNSNKRKWYTKSYYDKMIKKKRKK